MSKRAKSGFADAGRHLDLYPNFMTWSVTETAADAFSVQNIFTPIPRLQQRGNKAIVMELLELLVWVWATPYTISATFDAQFDSFSFECGTGAAPAALINPSAGNVFAMMHRGNNFVTSGMAIQEFPLRYSLVNNDGRGYLLGTDSFWCGIDSTATGVALEFDFKMMYRFVEVDITEFIGLVQSQTQSNQ
jgi:hypothetical protein